MCCSLLLEAQIELLLSEQVVNGVVIAATGQRAEYVRLGVVDVVQVNDVPVVEEQVVSDQAAMALAGFALCAHDNGGGLAGDAHESVDTVFKYAAGHVVGVGPEAMGCKCLVG